MASSKNEVFRALKPYAVALSQAVLSIDGPNKDILLVEKRIVELSTILEAQNVYLDDRLADYVFFPVSQILKQSQKVSVRCLESALSIITELIARGWQGQIQQQLAQQLLILCTLLAGGTSSIANHQTTPELQSNAFSCLTQLFKAYRSANLTVSLTDDSHMPQLGQTVSISLQAAHQSTSPSVQLAAIQSLHTLFDLSLPAHIFNSFLPGVVSTLTKVLTIQSQQRRRHEVLITALHIIERMLDVCFGTHEQTIDFAAKHIDLIDDNTSNDQAAAQVRLALLKIVKLHLHDRIDVKDALGSLCIGILRNCRETLSSCTELCLETILTLLEEDGNTRLRFELLMILSQDPALLASIQSTLFDWTSSLVRIMQSSDQEVKLRRLGQIASAYSCLAEAGIDLTTTSRMLGEALKTCVVLVFEDSEQSAISTAGSIFHMPQLTSAVTTTLTSFSPLMVSSSSQSVLEGIRSIVVLLSGSATNDLIAQLSHAHGSTHVANLWLVLQDLTLAYQQSHDINNMLVVDQAEDTLFERMEDTYAHALTLLANGDEISPTISSLSLQIIALRSRFAGRDFRFELVDALYPVLHSLATPHEELQQDSISTLNIISQSCGYASVQDLIIENVDYLTNAISLKLNTFDISPQVPQVLLMMVKLSGPALVPYLDDVVDSIFAALEDYHGYPLLVELLFKALAVIAEEGSKAPLIDARNDKPLLIVHRGVESWQSTSITDLVSMLQERKKEEKPTNRIREEVPQQPWAETKESREEEEEIVQESNDEQAPPAPKTYSILVKITESTQHFLPSASPSLRMSLLSLLQTTIPAIARHENTFLPLINTLWPEIVSRLNDHELSIQAVALNVISLLCEYAKDFMRSRVTELWPQICSIYRLVEGKFSTSESPHGLMVVSKSQGMNDTVIRKDTTTTTLLQPVLQLVTTIVSSVPLTPEMVDQALVMIGRKLDQKSIADVFERENSDAVWLYRWKSGLIDITWQPQNAQQFVEVVRSRS